VPTACPHTAINLNRNHQEWKGIVKAPFSFRMKLKLFDYLYSFKVGLKHLEKEIRSNRFCDLLCHYITFVNPSRATTKPINAITSAIADGADKGNSLLCLMQQLSALV
jgi:hypothetical protein